MKIIIDNNTIENLSLNGTCYVSPAQVDETIFSDDMTMIVEDDNGARETLEHVKFLNQLHMAGAYYLSFYQKSAEELAAEEEKSDIDALWEAVDYLMTREVE